MKLLTALLTAVALLAGSALAEDAKKCPFSGKDVDPGQSSTYSKKIEFCCEKCEAKFTAEPEKFADKIASYKAGEGKCLFNGKTASKNTEFKKEVGFCCAKCKEKFDAEPDKYLEKVVKK
jgi:YHS domain-containing protein